MSTKMEYGVCILLTVVLVMGSAALARAAGGSAAKDNYSSLCASCHGASGRGDGQAGAALPAKPTDFTDCAKITKVPDDTLFKATKAGGPAVGLTPTMPAEGAALSDAEIKDLVVYIRSFCGH